MSKQQLVLAKQRAKKMRILLIFTRIFSAIISFSAFGLVIASIDTSIWNFQSLWFGLKFIIFLFEILFLIVGYGIAIIFGFGDSGAVAIMVSIHSAIFGGNETILGITVEDLITNPTQIPTQQNLIDSLYAFVIMILIFVSLFAIFGFLRKCNPGLSAISFFALNLVLGLASLNNKLLLDLNIGTDSYFEIIFSQLVITAFFLYFSLELSFQASYIYSVLAPNVDRHRRISTNIQRLKDFEMPRGTAKKTNNISSQVSGKDTSTSRFSVTISLSKVKGFIGKKLFRISPEEDWDKMNLRLQNYYQLLEKDNPFLAVSLSASAFMPSFIRLGLIIIVGTLIRMVLLLSLSWLALNPVVVLSFLNFPETVISSVEAGQPEMVMFVLAPLAILFFLLGIIVNWIQITITKKLQKEGGKRIHTLSEQETEQEEKEEAATNSE
ncbi:MAG: hypothetical protein U9O98_09435 [Asgard group archaeon]|nr:hypothetical protein [Asgard group archaeon]